MRLAIVRLLILVFLLSILPSTVGFAQEGDRSQENQVGTFGVVPSGSQRFSRGRWSAMLVTMNNPSDEDREETVALFVGESVDTQFSRSFWVPARSRRQTWIPIRIPESTDRDLSHVPVSTMRFGCTKIRG